VKFSTDLYNLYKKEYDSDRYLIQCCNERDGEDEKSYKKAKNERKTQL